MSHHNYGSTPHLTVQSHKGIQTHKSDTYKKIKIKIKKQNKNKTKQKKKKKEKKSTRLC